MVVLPVAGSATACGAHEQMDDLESQVIASLQTGRVLSQNLMGDAGLAALPAPVNMRSRRRQETEDRLRAQNNDLVTLKAELEIRQLHEQTVHQLVHQ
jgi:hypothetical protein